LLQASLAEIGVTLDMKNVAAHDQARVGCQGRLRHRDWRLDARFRRSVHVHEHLVRPDQMGAPGNRAFYENRK
jgi:hypothetical protein